MPAVKKLYESYITGKNLANLRSDKDWEYRGNGEFGQPDWWSKGKQKYTYIFSDSTGDHGYLTFVFDHGPEGPFVGDLRVTDLTYDSPQAFLSILGFFYGMRSKLIHVILEIPDNIDMSVLIPECSHAEQTLGGHLMGRVLDVEKVLFLLSQPAAGLYDLSAAVYRPETELRGKEDILGQVFRKKFIYAS